MKKLWLILRVTLVLLVLVSAFVYFINWYVGTVVKGKTTDSVLSIPVENPPRIAIVFGAGVLSNGEPSNALYDRIVTAVELRRAGRVQKLLMSGDNRFQNYNEPQVMKETAMKLGVPAADIVQDFAGRRTYDTCYRAKNIFGVERAVIVTQNFHVDRATYLCQSLGVESFGIKADRRQYDSVNRRWWAFRESIAVVGAWFDLNVYASTPVLGNPETIE